MKIANRRTRSFLEVQTPYLETIRTQFSSPGTSINFTVRESIVTDIIIFLLYQEK